MPLSYSVSIALLYFALRGAHLGEFGNDLASMSWGWVAVAMAVGIILYLGEAVRWQYILRPVARLGYWATVRAVFVGLFANEVFSLHAGGLLRCYMLSRNMDLPLSVSIGGGLIGRLFEGFWWLLGMLLVVRNVPLPPEFEFLKPFMNRMAMVVVVSNVALAVVLYRRDKPHADVPASVWRRQFRVMLTDLRLMSRSRYLAYAFLQSLPLLLIAAIPIWAAFRAYGLDLSLGTAVSLMLLLRVGSSFPQAPGNLGIFQFLTRECLEKVFHVPGAEAARFSLVLWGIVTLPLMAGGLVALLIEGTKLGELQQAAQADAARLRAAQPDSGYSRLR